MSTPLPNPGDVLGGKYRLEQLLGQGGMGAVFEATHLVTGKRVAIKCQLPRDDSDAEAMSRFLREAQAAARVSHANIVDVYDVGEASGTLYLVMQYLDGVPLSSLLGGERLPIGPAVRTLISAMKGVQAAHRAGVIHRDLKPDNIFLCREADGSPAEPKVLDFGVAKLQASPMALAPSLTQSGSVMGTVYYMSPEQAEDARRVDARTDIYALGVILYELLGGARPFQGASLTAVLLQITRGQFAPLRTLRADVPAKLEQAVARAMAVDPAHRFPDIASFIEALEPFAAHSGLPASASQRPGLAFAVTETPLAVESVKAAESQPKASRRAPVFAVLLLLSLAVGTWLWSTRAVEQVQAPLTGAHATSLPPAATQAPGLQPSAASVQDTAAAAPPAAPPEQTTHATPKPVRPRVARPKASETAQAAPPTAPSAAAPQPPPAAEGKGRLKVGLSADQF